MPTQQIGRLERAVHTAEDACTNTQREAKSAQSTADKEITRYEHDKKETHELENVKKPWDSKQCTGREIRGVLSI